MSTQVNSSELVIIDTTILLLILKVPMSGTDQEFSEAFNKFNVLTEDIQSSIYLPMATIIETGNHIGQIADGNRKYNCTKVFEKLLNRALEANDPFTLVNCIDENSLKACIKSFSDPKKGDITFGDISIIQDWEKLRAENPRKRVYIWSKDNHLIAYDTNN